MSDKIKKTNCKVKIVLEGAAVVLEEGGWIRGQMDDGKGNFCALGAIRAAVEKEFPRISYDAALKLREGAKLALAKEVEAWYQKNDKPYELNYDKTVSIPTWNDAKERDRRTVVRVFRKAAASVDCP